MLIVACETASGVEGRALLSRASWGRDCRGLSTPGAGLWPPGVYARLVTKSRI